MTVNQPQAFPGTEAERVANTGTHDFDPCADRCTACDCRPWGRVAEWACGADVPREDV